MLLITITACSDGSATYTFYHPTEGRIKIGLYKDYTATVYYSDGETRKISWNEQILNGKYIALEQGNYGYIFQNYIYFDYNDMKAKRNGISIQKQ